MAFFTVTSNRECLIDGLGEFAAGEVKEVTPDMARAFQARHGYPLAEANFPPHIEFSTEVENDDESEGGE